jgi:thiamine transporter
MKSKQTTRILCEGGIMVAMAVVLNFLKFDLFAQGGSMNLLFIPLMVFALRRGTLWGLGAGLVFGVLKAIIGGGIAYGWQSLLLDYALAYALTGLAGLTPKHPVLGTVIGALGALFSFVLSGVFVWGEYMPETFLGLTMGNVWFYSFLYNGIYTAFNWLVAAIVIYILSVKTKLLQPEDAVRKEAVAH